jgi:hypothetical protein
VLLAGFSPEMTREVQDTSQLNYSALVIEHMLDSELVVVLRSAVDDHNVNVLAVALSALVTLLRLNAWYESAFDGVAGHQRLCLPPLLNGEEEVEMAESEDSKAHVSLSKLDLVAALLNMAVVDRMRYILECVPDSHARLCALRVLLALARHSSAACNQLFRAPRIPLVITALCKELQDGNSTTSTNTNTDISTSTSTNSGPGESEEMVWADTLLLLLRTLCQASQGICRHFLDNGLMLQLKRMFVLSIGIPGPSPNAATSSVTSAVTLLMSVRALEIWRISLCYGFEADLFLDMFPVLCRCCAMVPESNATHYALRLRQTRAVYNITTHVCRLLGAAAAEEADRAAQTTAADYINPNATNSNNSTTNTTSNTTTTTSTATATTTAKANASKFYAVTVGRVTGVYAGWENTKPQVRNYVGCFYKSFATHSGAQAYLDAHNTTTTTTTTSNTSTATTTNTSTTTTNSINTNTSNSIRNTSTTTTTTTTTHTSNTTTTTTTTSTTTTTTNAKVKKSVSFAAEAKPVDGQPVMHGGVKQLSLAIGHVATSVEQVSITVL